MCISVMSLADCEGTPEALGVDVGTADGSSGNAEAPPLLPPNANAGAMPVRAGTYTCCLHSGLGK